MDWNASIEEACAITSKQKTRVWSNGLIVEEFVDMELVTGCDIVEVFAIMPALVANLHTYYRTAASGANSK